MLIACFFFGWNSLQQELRAQSEYVLTRQVEELELRGIAALSPYDELDAPQADNQMEEMWRWIYEF